MPPELAPNSANGLIPSLIAWAKSQPPGKDAIVSAKRSISPCGIWIVCYRNGEREKHGHGFRPEAKDL